MKHPGDNTTMELPGLPPIPKKRGRKPFGQVAMTPAQRIKRYRTQSTAKPAETPRKPFTTLLDENLQERLRSTAQAQGIPMYQALELILLANL